MSKEQQRTTSVRGVATALLAIALLAAACSTGGDGGERDRFDDRSADAGDGGPGDGGLDDGGLDDGGLDDVVVVDLPRGVPRTSTLTWGPCGRDDLDGFECATLSVPLDRSDPASGPVELAVARSLATGPESDRIGSLLFNPGGPGGSGLDFLSKTVAAAPEGVRHHYDIVTWDPRGIGDSRPLLEGCAMPWVERPASGEVDWGQVFDEHVATMTDLNAACVASNADHIDHLGTMEVVQDLDALRAAVGDERLHYAGYSYGTRIGAVYAQLHPDRVAVMLLDGSVDPSGSMLGLVTEGARANEVALGHMYQVEPAIQAALPGALEALEAAPVSLPDGRTYTRWDLVDALVLRVGDQSKAADALAMIEAASTAATDAPGAAEAASALIADLDVRGRGPDLVPDNTDTGGMFPVVNCLDYTDRPSLEQLRTIVQELAGQAPILGPTLATNYASGCAGFDLDPDPIPLAMPTGGDQPVLISATTRDARTPFEWSARMARAFPNSRMVTYPGGQHVAWMVPSPCVEQTFDAYFVDGALPSHDLVCGYSPIPPPASPDGAP